MRFNLYPNAAALLKAIRDGKAKTLSELEVHFIPESFSHRKVYINDFQSSCHRLLIRLVHAGLLEMGSRRTFTATGIVDPVLSALDLSLTELSKQGPDSMQVSPIFGPPKGKHIHADVFVLMPFAENLRPVYEDHIRAVVQRNSLKIARADDFFATEAIVTDIWYAICSCQIVVADCTGRNPNVFYEIGMAHTVGRPTILITQDIDDVPFDLRHLRCITYKYTPRGMRAFEEKLEKTLETELGKLDASEPVNPTDG